MSLVTFSSVTRFYGKQEVLNNVTFSLEPGEKVGLVGRNGAGKTTIIRLILEEEMPDKGLVTRNKGLKVGYLPQEILTQSEKTLLELVLDTDPEYSIVEKSLREVEQKLASLSPDSPKEISLALAEKHSNLLNDFEHLGGWEKETTAKKILSGLGFLETDLTRNINEFSGGWIMRAILARLLLAQPDLLILDEPTNHLDLDSLMWLEGYLKTTTSAILLVSHDRVFINNLVGKILEIRNTRIDTYTGNYEDFVATKAMRLETETAAYHNQLDRIRQLEKFIQKNRTRASTAKRAQSRVKELDKIERLSAPHTDNGSSFKLALPVGKRGPEAVTEIQNATKTYGDQIVFNSLNLNLRRGQKLALVCPNGRGKSTLIKLIVGLIKPTSGDVRIGQNVDIGYFSQFQMDCLNPDFTILEEFSSICGSLTQGKQRSILGAFLFTGEDVFKKVKVLSGGEKTRLVLAKIMMQAPNLLLLDEPTNHLDIQGRQMLEDALSDYTGTMILISHDRHFINKLATSIGIIENGELTIYPGDFDDYQEIWLKKNESLSLEPLHPNSPKTTPKTQTAPAVSPKKIATKDNSKEIQKLKKNLLSDIKNNETLLEELKVKLTKLDSILSSPLTYQDSQKVKSLIQNKKALREKEQEIEKIYEQNLISLEELS
ncbi:MAG: ATP-binding cassette domain-containing protein [Deltaproteobacteria bacterium]|nr:ATP-binding cassette domain-containing protein [Deltaproteobacteria bacterium]